jgi:hypothetical protein
MAFGIGKAESFFPHVKAGVHLKQISSQYEIQRSQIIYFFSDKFVHFEWKNTNAVQQ